VHEPRYTTRTNVSSSYHRKLPKLQHKSNKSLVSNKQEKQSKEDH